MTKKKTRKAGREKVKGFCDNILDSYLNDIARTPLLTREEEVKVAKEAAAGSMEARNKLINANLRFVVRIAKKYQGHGLPLEDLINEGNIGLIKATENYDASRGFHFISYAVWWIRQSIITAISEKARIIRMPMHWNTKLLQIQKIRQMIHESQDHVDELKEIASQLGIDSERIKELVFLGQEVISLDQPTKDNGYASTIVDFLECENQSSPEEIALKGIMQNDINNALKILNKKEAAVIKARFGLTDGIPRSLEEIGDFYNISKEGVRQIENKALNLLRQSNRSRALEHYVA